MKRLLLTLLVLLSLEIYIPQVVQAQSYEEVEGIMKGYCSRIDVQDGSFDTDQFVKISPVTTESGVDSVLIKGVTVTDTKTGSSQSFDIGKTFTSSQLAGGVAFQVPSLTFMQSESKSTSGRDQFTMNFDKIVTFQNPDFDVSKPTKQTATVNCKDSAAMNLSPSAQAGGTSQSSSTTNTTAANPAGPKVTGSGKELNVFCDEAKTKINTAIGCIPITATEDTIGWLLGWAIGISGGYCPRFNCSCRF